MQILFLHFRHMHVCNKFPLYAYDQSCKVLTCGAESPSCELGAELFISRLIMPKQSVWLWSHMEGEAGSCKHPLILRALTKHNRLTAKHVLDT